MRIPNGRSPDPEKKERVECEETRKVAADGWTTAELNCSKCRWLAWSVCPLRACLYRELWQGRLSVRACRAALAQSRLLIRSLTGRVVCRRKVESQGFGAARPERGVTPDVSPQPVYLKG
jgi:hypothetical protein